MTDDMSDDPAQDRPDDGFTDDGMGDGVSPLAGRLTGAAAGPSADPDAMARAGRAAVLDADEEDDAPPEGEEIDMDAVRDCAPLDPSDTDNGQRLIRHFGQDLKVVARQGVAGGDWMAWAQTHWEIGEGAARAEMMAQRMGPRIKLEAAHVPALPHEIRAMVAAEPFRGADPETLAPDEKAIALAGRAARKRWQGRKSGRRSYGVSCKNAARIANMLGKAQPHLRVSPDALNADPLLIATRTHTIRLSRCIDDETPDPDAARHVADVTATPGHRREDLLTAVVPVDYDAAATCPRWLAFLEKQLPDEGKRRTVQEYAGLGLTGIPVQRIMFHYGAGANGKSVFMETLFRLVGDSFGVALPAESISGQQNRNAGGASPDLIRLFGKRMLRVSELPAGKMVDVELIKRLTGGEKIAVRDLFAGYIEFMNRAKAHWSGNDKPQLDGSDYAIFRRLLLVHWNVTIPEAERRDIEEVVREFLAEGPGILNWMIEGARRYLAAGSLDVAETIRDDTEEYRLEMDPVGAFFAACVQESPGVKTPFKDMFEAYAAWCESAGRNEPRSKNKFGRLAKKKFRSTNVNGLPVYHDIQLVNVPERQHRAGEAAPRSPHKEPPARGNGDTGDIW